MDQEHSEGLKLGCSLRESETLINCCTAYGFLGHSLKQDCDTMQSH